ncbi:MAG: ABC transporter permease [Paludibacter sp.]|nr:ABC transporter permease [Bacteroidales bacterium]MCM1068490.1 ABC transporter permease [Prevotella sp.]MCM1353444.1 ABC transporter permease [Bacteroides sp.]MCM1442605.1 ABC transporter permease [Muribaculum sp.]MCM1481450.1 ABC transporter permease [Paludibacter sp.]
MDFLNEIWTTITKNRSRSLLTAFGVFWGMLMLVVMVGLGQALKNGIFSSIDGFTMNTTIMGTGYTSKPYKGFQRGRHWDILTSDFPVLRQQVQGLDALVPMVFSNTEDNNVSHADRYGTYSVVGVTPEFTQVLRTELAYGRFINSIDIREKRKVCVIGQEVYKVLFPQGGNPIGTSIRANGIWYQVVGVKQLCTTDVYIGGHPDKQVQVPLTALQQAYNLGDVVHILLASTQPGVRVSQVEKGIKDVLRRQHQVAPDDERAMFSQNVEETFKAMNYLTIGLSALIWIIGLGTLFSGAVGVSNILLVTVRERTKEIGIRRAIGAPPSLIAIQILAESTLLTALAGTIGIVTGVGLLQLISPILDHSDVFIKDPQITFPIAVSALIIIIIIGIIAGLLPAMRALAVKPIEALSEE